MTEKPTPEHAITPDTTTHDTTTPRTIVLVHAHPDDETLATGVTIAEHVLRGDEVTVLTCTLGDEGEIIPPELAHLGPAAEDRLGPYRRGELWAALYRIGARGVLLADEETAEPGEGPGFFRDSGMAGTAANAREGALAHVDLEEVVTRLAAALEALDPDIVITYDRTGGYGHPDHVRVHEATVAATARLTRTPALYAVVTPRSWIAHDRQWVSEYVDAGRWTVPDLDAEYIPSAVDDDAVTHVVRGSAMALARRDDALREHRTQVRVHDGWFTLSNDVATRLAGAEAFVRITPGTGAPYTPSGEPGPLEPGE